MATTQPVLYRITEITADSTYEKANEVYLTFSVKDRPGKKKTSVIAHDSERYTWGTEVLELEVHDAKSAELEVSCHTKRTLIPDHLVGEFTIKLPGPGTSVTLSGAFLKKGTDNGKASFKISSEAAAGHKSGPAGAGATAVGAGTVGAAAAARGAGHGKHSNAAPSHTAADTQPVEYESETASGTLTGQHPQTAGIGGSTSHPSTKDQARAKTDAVAQEATEKTNTTALEAENRTNATALEAESRANATALEAENRTNATAQQATGKTFATVDAAQNKLQDWKLKLAEGQHAPHTSGATEPGVTGGQSAYNRTLGVPPDAGTASDAGGTAAAGNAPFDVAVGGASGAVGGPVAPTGHGGILTDTGANASPTAGPTAGGGIGGTLRSAAMAATDRATQALETAKQTFSHSTTPSVPPK